MCLPKSFEPLHQMTATKGSLTRSQYTQKLCGRRSHTSCKWHLKWWQPHAHNPWDCGIWAQLRQRQVELNYRTPHSSSQWNAELLGEEKITLWCQSQWSVPGKVRRAEHAQGGRPSPARHKAMLVFPVYSIAGILFLFSFLFQFFFWMGKYRHLLAHLNRPLRRSLPLPATRGSWFYLFLPCPSGAFSWFASYSRWNTA